MGSRNALERIIKCIPIFMILILGFIMRCELFHSTLINSMYALYPAMNCNVTESEFNNFMKQVKQDADKAGVSCFAVGLENDSRLSHSYTIFTHDEVPQDMLQKNNIIEGNFESLLNGSSSIIYQSMEELSYENFIQNPYFLVIGDSENVTALYNKMSSQYDIGYPQIMQRDETDMIIIVWVMIVIFIILINASLIFRKKKEILIKEIYGEDVVRITMQAFLLDIITFELLYILAKVVVSSFTSGDYKPQLAFIIYQIGIILASSINFVLLKSDIKAVFANVIDNRKTLKWLYILKGVAFLLVVFTLTTNLTNLKNVTTISKSDEIYSLYKDKMFLAIENGGNIDVSRQEARDEIWSKIYGEYYDEVKPIIATKLADAKNEILLLNEYAIELLPQKIKNECEKNTGVTIIYPEKAMFNHEDMSGLLGLYVDELDTNWSELTYDTHMEVSYISSNEMSSFSTADNPLILYCGSDIKWNTFAFADSRDVIYNVEENQLAALDELLNVTANDYKLTSTNMGEFYNYQMNFVMQMIRFLSSLCVLVIILNIAITVALTNLEYRIHGMEYALKKVLGYNLFVRNKHQLIANNIVNGVLIIILSIFGVITGIHDMFLCMWVGVAILAVENIVAVFNIIRIEKQSIRKTLKGGCL